MLMRMTGQLFVKTDANILFDTAGWYNLEFTFPKERLVETVKSFTFLSFTIEIFINKSFEKIFIRK